MFSQPNKKNLKVIKISLHFVLYWEYLICAHSDLLTFDSKNKSLLDGSSGFATDF